MRRTSQTIDKEFPETQKITSKASLGKILEVKEGKARIILTESANGKLFRQPVTLWIPLKLTKAQQALYEYIYEALSPTFPRLIPFAANSQAVMKLVKYMLRHRTGSTGTFNQYIWSIAKYCSYTNLSPDQLVAECQSRDGYPDPKSLHDASLRLDEYVGELQAEGLAPGSIANRTRPIKTFYMVNGLTLTLPYKLNRRIVNRDRSPKPEELQRLIDIANLREKVIVSITALGGFRTGTLAKLRYRHVQEDLERGITPVHIHVEAQITKGKYCDYDTFIGKEAVDWLKAYLDIRRLGSPSGKIPPEEIHEESPLIRDTRSRKPRPIDRRSLYQVIHNLYKKAGMLKRGVGRRYQICAHSLRKYFRTQLAALGVPSDYIEYMMGHKISTYHDVQMKGIEFLRGVYTASGLAIRPKTKLRKIEALKEIIRAWGMNPEEILTRKALTMPAAKHVCLAETEDSAVQELRNALKEMMRTELLNNKPK